ncbi:MAG TPA: GumC family protein [Desulfomonilaceae bacterium]|nr:GumC family protein [Desulfomonilaceae bacterium]
MEPRYSEDTGIFREEPGLSLRDTLNILYRRIFLLRFFVVALPLGVLAACFIVKPVYESTAKVLVTGKKETTTLLQGAKDLSASMFLNMNVDETDLNSEMELLRSLELWTRAVRKLEIATKPQDQGSLVEKWKTGIKDYLGIAERPADKTQERQVLEISEVLLKDFRVTPVVKSKVLDLAFKYSDREMTQKILATVLDLYIPYHQEVYSLPGAQGFFSGQGDMYKDKFDQADRELAGFKKKWGISLPERQKTELISSLKLIEDSLVEVKSNMSQYEYMMSLLQKGILPTGQLAASMQRGNENTVVNLIISQLLRAEQKRIQTWEVFSPESRDRKAADELVADLTRKLREAIQSETDVLAAKRSSLEQSLTAKQSELRQLEEKSEEARRLQLDVTIAKERYLQYLAKEEEARLENLKVGKHLVNVAVVAKPFLPADPIFPKTLLFVIGAFFVAIPLGIGLVLVANFFDHTFDSPGALEASTNRKVLASIGKMKKT